MKTISPEVAKELAEALRRVCHFIVACRKPCGCPLCEARAVLAKFDAEQVARSGVTHSDECWRWHHGCAIEKLERAEQGKAAEVSEPDSHRIALKLTSLLGYIDMAIQSVSVVKERIEQEIPSLAPVPVPSPVRAPAVVAAQGVTERILRYIAMRKEKPLRGLDDQIHGIHIGTEFEASLNFSDLESFAATRAQQGGEDARDARRYRWLRKQHWSWAEYCVVRDPKNAIRLGHNCPSHDLLDEAIDAAHRREGGEGE